MQDRAKKSSEDYSKQGSFVLDQVVININKGYDRQISADHKPDYKIGR